MIDINLIAQRRQQKLRTTKLLRVSFYGTFLLAVAICLLYAGMTVKIWRINSDIVACDAKLGDPILVRSLEHVTFLEEQTAQLRPRVDLLRRVQASQRSWVTVLEQFSGAVPSNVWMTALNSKINNNKQSLVVAGNALNHGSVGNFMLNLKHADWCQPPTLSFTRTTKASGREVVSFELGLDVDSPIGSDIK